MNKFKRNYMIKMKDIVLEGANILRKKLKEVPFPLTNEDKGNLVCMLNFLKNSQDPVMAEKHKLRAGVGLSANQIGLNKRMFVMYIDGIEYILINPKIISHSINIVYLPDGEGCLSVNRDVLGYVPRYERIKISAYNIDGEIITHSFSGYEAIVAQHEFDHLNGIMFYDRINKSNPFELPKNEI
ncbi:peptide deformylase [Lysinibacillus sp. CTST325]